jgi:hypothetical protein
MRAGGASTPPLAIFQNLMSSCYRPQSFSLLPAFAVRIFVSCTGRPKSLAAMDPV